MARRWHSASSCALGARCRRAWYYRYVEGIREPDLSWDQIASGKVEYTSRQRSCALGKEVHRILEEYYRTGNWTGAGFPEQVALSGMQHLPVARAGDLGRGIHPELAIGTLPVSPLEVDDPPTVLELHGILWAGYIDLVTDDLVIDYKTTSNIEKYAKSADDLGRDVAANLYALGQMFRAGLDRQKCRWVYFETGRTRRSRRVEFEVTRANALRVLGPVAQLAKELDLIQTISDAPQNRRSCGDFGGCPFHLDQGGPCDARPSAGAMIQSTVPRKETMPLDPKTQSSFAAARARAAAAKSTPAPAAPAPAAPAPAAPAPAAPAPAAPAPAAPARRGRPPKPKPDEAEPQIVEVPTEPSRQTRSEQLSGLVISLREAELRVTDAEKEVGLILSEIALLIALD